MLPVLLDLGFIKIYTLGVFLVLGFFWSAFLIWKNIKLTSYKEEEVFDGIFLSLISGLIFARIFYIALNFEEFGFNFLKFILVNGFPGLSLIGGLVGGFLALVVYTRVKKFSFLDLSEYVISPLFLAFGIGKIGSFFSGTDLGRQTSFPLNIHYIGHEGTRHIPAIYEALIFFIGFYISYRLLFMVRRDKVFNGASFALFILLFTFSQIIVDNLKQNHLYLADLSFNFIVSTGLFVFTALFLATRYRKILIRFATKNVKKLTNRKPAKGSKK